MLEIVNDLMLDERDDTTTRAIIVNQLTPMTLQ
jgi:hypothetical protein